MVRIKDLSKVDRPREKLIKYGSQKLNTSELLAIILRTGTKEQNVVELANKILKKFGIDSLSKVSFSELREIKGLGDTKACEIIACIELGKRFLKEKIPLKVTSPQDIFDSLKDIRNHKKEHFIAIYLDTRNQEIAREVISIGTLNSNLVHPREVFEPAIRYLAASIIIVHNHPSGDTEPSEEDLDLTKRLSESGRILGIEITDHIIISSTKLFSFKNKNLI